MGARLLSLLEPIPAWEPLSELTQECEVVPQVPSSGPDTPPEGHSKADQMWSSVQMFHPGWLQESLTFPQR